MGLPSFALHDADASAHYEHHGWVLIDTFSPTQVEQIRAWVDEIAGWPDDAGDHLHYREMTDFGSKLCRTENFVPFHPGMRSLLTEGRMVAIATALLGSEAVLYKEKINYKLVGGAGFAPHQDAPAYPFLDAHVSCMVSVDDADEANGCLEVVSGRYGEVLPMDEVGCVRSDVVAGMAWTFAPVRAGQTLWFHSRTPHRSGPNVSRADRRALYPTYNALVEGDLRDAYYAEKLQKMAASSVGEHVQVSLIGDFQGRPVV